MVNSVVDKNAHKPESLFHFQAGNSHCVPTCRPRLLTSAPKREDRFHTQNRSPAWDEYGVNRSGCGNIQLMTACAGLKLSSWTFFDSTNLVCVHDTCIDQLSSIRASKRQNIPSATAKFFTATFKVAHFQFLVDGIISSRVTSINIIWTFIFTRSQICVKIPI